MQRDGAVGGDDHLPQGVRRQDMRGTVRPRRYAVQQSHGTADVQLVGSMEQHDGVSCCMHRQNVRLPERNHCVHDRCDQMLERDPADLQRVRTVDERNHVSLRLQRECLRRCLRAQRDAVREPDAAANVQCRWAVGHADDVSVPLQRHLVQ